MLNAAPTLTQIRNGEASAAVASNVGSTKIAGLRGANRGVPVVIQNKELDRQLKPEDGLQFLNVELKPAVAIHQQ